MNRWSSNVRATDLTPHEIERLRRSAVMAAPNASSGLSAGQVVTEVTQLVEVTQERDRLLIELNEIGPA
jgi:hypothetical protein